MEQHILRIVNKCFNTNIYSYLETSGGQSYNPYLNVVNFSTPVITEHLWQLDTYFPALVSNTCCSIVLFVTTSLVLNVTKYVF